MQANPSHSRAGTMVTSAGKALAGACLMLTLGISQAAESADPETTPEGPSVEMPAQTESESGMSFEPRADAETPDERMSETPDERMSETPDEPSLEEDRPAEAQDVPQDRPTESPDVATPQPTESAPVAVTPAPETPAAPATGSPPPQAEPSGMDAQPPGVAAETIILPESDIPEAEDPPAELAAPAAPQPAERMPFAQSGATDPRSDPSPGRAAPAAPRDQPVSPAPITPRPQVDTGPLMVRGEALLREGDIAGARLFFERAAAAGDRAAMTALGRTYDPIELRRMGVLGIRGDADRALAWYRSAAEAGDASAQQSIGRLSEWMQRTR